jgi:pimeloyl-ACP methyl ester carboxylesterase
MDFLDIQGKKVHVVEMNRAGGSPVVMVHGLFTNMSVYFFGIAPRVSKRRRVILYDLRSHGMSEHRDEGYTLELLSEDLLALMDVLGIFSADVVGYSYGGTTALYTALKHPDRIRKLALIDAPILTEAPLDQLIKSRADDASVEKALVEYTRSTGIPITERKAQKMKAQYRCLFENDLLPKAIRSGRGFADRLPPENLTVRTLLLYGRKSPYLETGHMLAARIPHAELRTAPGDHNLPVQRALWVSRRLRKFFRKGG